MPTEVNKLKLISNNVRKTYTSYKNVIKKFWFLSLIFLFSLYTKYTNIVENQTQIQNALNLLSWFFFAPIVI